MPKILIVEDDFDIQELLENFLQENAYETATANDGIEAITLFNNNQFDLILLDIMLPKIDGYTICELIRKNTSISKVELYTNTGVLIDTPSNNKNEIGIVGEAISGTSYEQIPIISNTYRCIFAGNNNQYILIVYGEASQIMVLKQTFLHILPLLLSIIILLSFE